MSAQAIRLTEVDIDNALANRHLDVVFQPIFSLRDGGLVRHETFVRWEHPGLGLLPPGAFISFFEAQGRMGELTRYVVREAAAAYAARHTTGGPGFSVNLSQSDVADAAFAGDLAEILRAAMIAPSLVTLECPPFAPDTHAADAALMLGRLARTGCPLSAEVRGRAGDVLSSFDPFPFAEVKTGGSAILRFARTAKGGPGLAAISDLLDVAKRHGASAVAVGIEDEASARALAELGFDAGQGKLFGGTGALDAVGGAVVNAVRAALGHDPLDQDALSDLAARPTPAAPLPAKLAPLILNEPVAAAPDIADAPARAPDEPDPTTLAIARLKAKKIAAKKAALRRAQAEEAQAEAEAARAATDTARRLQERIAAEMNAPSEAEGTETVDAPAPTEPAHHPATTEQAVSDGAPEQGHSTPSAAAPIRPDAPGAAPHGAVAAAVKVPPTVPPAAVRTAEPRPAATASLGAPMEDDAEAGVLLSQNLAEIALGVSRQTSFAEGIRLDGYATSGGNALALQGAVAPDAAPEVRRGDAEAEPFIDIAAAIHDILADLPVPESAKPRLIRSAEMPLANRGMPPVPAEMLDEDLSPEDALDAVVAASPLLDEDTPDGALAEAVLPTAADAVPARRRPRPKTNLLTRRYRITHFWPRAWVRTVQRVKAARAAADEAQELARDALAA